jgi:hypothetical protein
LCKLACALAVVAGIQFQQLLDLGQGKACRLGLLDEAQAPDILASIAPHAAVPGGLREEALALVEAHRFDSDARLRGELSDGEGTRLLTLYHGTDLI